VLGELRGPEAEPIVVLGGQDEQLDAGVFEHSRPLVGVKVGRVEQRWVFLALGAEAWVVSRVGKDRLGREIPERFQVLSLPADLVTVEEVARHGGRRLARERAGSGRGNSDSDRAIAGAEVEDAVWQFCHLSSNLS